jgi:hypothetical protein
MLSYRPRFQRAHEVPVLADVSYTPTNKGAARMWILSRAAFKGLIFIVLPRIIGFIHQALTL